MVFHVDPRWAHEELIPFLSNVFQGRSLAHWVEQIERAEMVIDKLDFNEDFPYTVECVRMSLINPSVLLEEEATKFARFKRSPEQTVNVLVRHAIRQRRWYPLHSLGGAQDPDFIRPQTPASEKSDEIQDDCATSSNESGLAKPRDDGSKFANENSTNIFQYERRENFLDMAGKDFGHFGGFASGLEHPMGANVHGEYSGHMVYGKTSWENNFASGFVNISGQMFPPGHPGNDSFQAFNYAPPSVAFPPNKATTSKLDTVPHEQRLRVDAKEFLPGAYSWSKN